MDSVRATTAEKRKASDVLVDPDTNQKIEDAKRPRIDLDAARKYNCLKAIVEMYREIINMAFAPSRPTPVSSKIASGGTQRMDVEDPDPTNQVEEARLNITVGNHIISIIFTIHNINRQKTKGVETNMIKKTSGTAFKIHYKGNDYPLESEELMKTWERITKENNLIYKEFSQGDTENWYGTMGPYIDMFSAYALRTNELRLGHNNMPITKVDGVHRSFPVSKYGLSGAHHVLLEGTSFPPERRSSIVQSLGPMTAWLCMIRSEGLYRNKYAAAVKRAMSHIPCIDDIIEITKTTKQASEISMLTTLIAEILLITTARQATRMFFPITIFAYVWGLHANPRDFCDFFSTTGAGGWYTYKAASERNPAFTICGKMETEKASQIVFHSIFGTYKEDLSILSQITSVSLWYTREQMGTCFRQQGSSTSTTKIELPKMRFYAKMSCANQTGLLSGVYNQVVTVPCFSGKRTHRFDESFFDHIEKKKIISTSGKTISQIVNILTSILEELHATIKRDQGKIQMGTTQWRDMGSLDLNTPGDTVNIVLEGSGKMFLGKN